MSEFEDFDFNLVAPEIQISVHEFDRERLELYDWLALKVQQNVKVPSFNSEASRAARDVSGKFVSSAFEIRQRVEDPRLASFIIADNWYSDEQDRNKKFSEIVSGTSFEILERPYIDQEVSNTLNSSRDDLDVFIDRMYKGYSDSILCDVAKLLGATHSLQERDLMAFTGNLPLSTPESTHIYAPVDVLKGLSKVYAQKVLQHPYSDL